MLIQQLVNGLVIGSIYALFGVGYTLIFGVLDLLNLAHGSIFMAGALISWVLVTVFQVNFFALTILHYIQDYTLSIFLIRYFPFPGKK